MVEILSPRTAQKDRWIKKALYEKHGVKEYILVDSEGQFAELFLLNQEGKYDSGKSYGVEDTMQLSSLDNLKISMEDVFDMEALESE